MSKIQIISDVHLEFFNNKNFNALDFLTPSADYLIIAGDLGYPKEDIYMNFLDKVSVLFKRVFLISGNHEYYNRGDAYDSIMSIEMIDNLIDSLITKYDNVYYLNNRTYVLDDNYVLIGTTLWTYISEFDSVSIRKNISDYRYIYINDKQKINTLNITNIYRQNVKWLKSTLDEYANTDKKIIVITHHLPTFKLVHPKYYTHMELNIAYSSNLDELIEKYASSIKYWIYGHTHTPYNAELFGVKFVANPIGYRSENLNYDKMCVIDLD